MRFSEFDFDVITSADELPPAKAPAEPAKPRAGNEAPNDPKPETRESRGCGQRFLQAKSDA